MGVENSHSSRIHRLSLHPLSRPSTGWQGRSWALVCPDRCSAVAACTLFESSQRWANPLDLSTGCESVSRGIRNRPGWRVSHPRAAHPSMSAAPGARSLRRYRPQPILRCRSRTPRGHPIGWCRIDLFGFSVRLRPMALLADRPMRRSTVCHCSVKRYPCPLVRKYQDATTCRSRRCRTWTEGQLPGGTSCGTSSPKGS